MCIFTRHEPAYRSAVLQAGPGELPQCVDLSGGWNLRKHHPAVPLRAQANWFSDVGNLGNGDVSGTVYRNRPRTGYSGREAAPRPACRLRSGSGEAFGGQHAGETGMPSAAESWDGLDVRQEVDRILLSRYSPAGTVADDQLEVLEIRGKANDFLRCRRVG